MATNILHVISACTAALNARDYRNAKARAARLPMTEQFAAVGRADRAAVEQAEVSALEAFLPPQVPPDEIRAAVRAAIAGGASDVGKVMGQVMPTFKGRADGKLINQIAREELSASV